MLNFRKVHSAKHTYCYLELTALAYFCIEIAALTESQNCVAKIVRRKTTFSFCKIRIEVLTTK